MQAFQLGQICFAQSFSGQAMLHRADDEFVVVLKDPAFVNFFALLMTQESTFSEIVEVVKQPNDEVRQNIRKFIELGIIDFRSNGKENAFFLTPAAKTFFR